MNKIVLNARETNNWKQALTMFLHRGKGYSRLRIAAIVKISKSSVSRILKEDSKVNKNEKKELGKIIPGCCYLLSVRSERKLCCSDTLHICYNLLQAFLSHECAGIQAVLGMLLWCTGHATSCTGHATCSVPQEGSQYLEQEEKLRILA
jgi:hypothetical protein